MRIAKSDSRSQQFTSPRGKFLGTDQRLCDEEAVPRAPPFACAYGM